MEPNKFRQSRQAINRMVDKVDQLIELNDVEESKSGYEKVSAELDALRPEAEGEIQERSVKNLGIKVHHLAVKIDKLKTKRSDAKRSSGSKELIEWDEERVGTLSAAFLKKLLANMGNDPEAKVCFGTTGKGIRPNYRVCYADGKVIGFTGSGHKPQDKLPASSAKNLSNYFPRQVVETGLSQK